MFYLRYFPDVAAQVAYRSHFDSNIVYHNWQSFLNFFGRYKFNVEPTQGFVKKNRIVRLHFYVFLVPTIL